MLFSLLLTDTIFMGEEAKMWLGGQTRKAKNSVIFHIAMEIRRT